MYDHIIFHIDVNSAYLSWSAIRELEQGSKTDLRLVPSIVGGDVQTRHGVVLAKSIPAKRYGIQTGEPVVNALKKCPGIISVRPDHQYYKEKSRQLMAYLREYCPAIEQVSVDECYLDYSKMLRQYPSPEVAAEEIKNSIREKFGYTVNIGISDRKVLAKMASDFQKPDLVHTLYFDEIQEKMWPLPVEELFMCGHSAAKTLKKLGIQTIGELAQADTAMIETHLKKQGHMLQKFARGVDDSTVHASPSKAKGIGNSVTLSSDAKTREDAEKVLYALSEKVAGRLQKEQVLAGSICIEIKYASFQSVSHQRLLDRPTADQGELGQNAVRLFEEIWNGEPVRLLGIRTGKLKDEDAPIQMTIFDYQKAMPKLQKNMEKKKKLDAAMASIRKKYGENAVNKGFDTFADSEK